MFPKTKENNQSSSQDSFLGKTILSKYTLISKLGEGSFGKTYKASSQDGRFFAIKFEKRTDSGQLLEIEGYILNYLKGPGIPLYEAYSSTQDYNLLVMQLLGKSLEKKLSSTPKKRLSIRTVCNIAIQMISILKHVHDNHIIHRDLKPDNFTIGLDKDSNKIFLIDFGLAKKYRSSKTLEQFPLKKGKKLTGTARYASINALGGLEQSRRDDLESISYVLMYLLKGSLPWQGLPMKKVDERYVKIYEKKKSVTAWELCRGYPKQFEEFVSYTRKLGYKEDPNYEYLQQLMNDVLYKEGFEFDYYTEWSESIANRSHEVGNIKGKKNVLTVDRCYQKNCKTFSCANPNSNRSNVAINQSMNKSNEGNSPCRNENDINNSNAYKKYEIVKESNFNLNNKSNKKESAISFYKVKLPLKRYKSMEYISHSDIPLGLKILTKANEKGKDNENMNKTNEKTKMDSNLKKQPKTMINHNILEINNNLNVNKSEYIDYQNKQGINNQNTKSAKGFNDSGINTRRKGNQPLYKKLSTSEHRGSRCCIIYNNANVFVPKPIAEVSAYLRDEIKKIMKERTPVNVNDIIQIELPDIKANIMEIVMDYLNHKDINEVLNEEYFLEPETALDVLIAAIKLQC